MREISVGIVGLGYWGPNLLRNFRSIEDARVVAIADLDQQRVATQSRLYPDLRCVETAAELIEDDTIEALVFAVPAGILPDLAIGALEAGKHVMVEKPMAHSLEVGVRMRDAAERSGRIAMVDFTFCYSPPVRYLRSLVESGSLGTAHYYHSTRINLGRFQPDVDVLWDLGVHDVSILAYLFDMDPVSVMATGRGAKDRVDTAHMTLIYEDGMQAFIHVSWMAPMKVRMSLLAAEAGMVVYNDVEKDEKIRIYKAHGHFNPASEDSLVPTFRLGDVAIPRLPNEEPLRNAGEAFLDAIRKEQPPLTDWRFGTRVLAVLEAARRSLGSERPERVETV